METSTRADRDRQLQAARAARGAKALSKMPKSAMTNGRTFATTTDGRSSGARRQRDLISIFSRAVGGANLTEMRRQMIRRLAALCCRCEWDEGAIAHGAAIDYDSYLRAAALASRLMQRLGLAEPTPARKPTESAITRSDPLRAYLASRAIANKRKAVIAHRRTGNLNRSGQAKYADMPEGDDRD